MTVEERNFQRNADNGRHPKDLWDKVRAIGPLVVALAVSAIGGWYGYKQVELQVESQNFQRTREENARRQQVFIELISRRESSDNSLRASMFNTLFNAYFGESVTDSESSELKPPKIKHQIMFLHLLARNFETIDIKPLFEEMDQRLTAAVGDEGLPMEQRRCCFSQREYLRHVGFVLASRQVSAICSLKGTRAQIVTITQYDNRDTPRIVTEGDDLGIELQDITIDDGKVTATFHPLKPRSGRRAVNPIFSVDPTFSISFFDMPYIDNSRFTSGSRLAVVMEKFISPYDYGPFLDQISDPSLRQDYRDLTSIEPHILRIAVLRLVLFPEGYLGLRDRPYLEEVIQKITKGIQE